MGQITWRTILKSFMRQEQILFVPIKKQKECEAEAMVAL